MEEGPIAVLGLEIQSHADADADAAAAVVAAVDLELAGRFVGDESSSAGRSIEGTQSFRTG